MFNNTVEHNLPASGSIALQPPPSLLALLTGLVLLLIAMALLGISLTQATTPASQAMLWDNFYRTERLATMDYRFSQPRAAVLIPDPPLAPAQLVFRAVSPTPLPPRPLTIRYDQTPMLTIQVGPTPRIYRTLLLPGTLPPDAGRLIGLETTGAYAPDDPRLLGFMFDSIEVQPLTPAPFPWVLVSIGAVYSSLALLLILLRTGWVVSGLAMVMLTIALLISQPLFFILGSLATPALLIAWAYAPILTRTTIQQIQTRLEAVLVSPSRFLLLAIGSAYAITIACYAIVNHEHFGTNAYDLGIYDHSLWLISHGFYPYNTGSGRHVLGTHAAAILYPLSTLYWLLSDVRLLLAFQALVTALSVLPLYLIAQSHSQAWAGLLVGAAYLLHPATQNMTLFDFHPDTIAATALLFALWGIDRRRWGVVTIASLITLTSKEIFSVTIAFIGLWLLLHKEWRMGTLLLLLGVGWFFFATKLLIPSLTGQPDNHFLVRFSRYGDDFWSIVWTFLTRPDSYSVTCWMSAIGTTSGSSFCRSWCCLYSAHAISSWPCLPSLSTC